MDSIFGVLGVILGLAYLIETLVEAIFGRVVDHVTVLQPFKWTLVYVAVGVGVIGAFIYQYDLIYLLSQFMGVPVEKTGFGITITGVGIGMGAAYIHQFVSKFFPAKNG